ncbi:uncharacterized protein ARMOST_02458 [Armillaria ostoyae]|uniref:Uncharacterized protein n=1 Tax=Armillaria ostoyae TaxID=47428 RepID=A0A284QRR5_ARMOS|nr:uncharacterized protein ARMOST_02458 [Armillaria ostoyae]
MLRINASEENRSKPVRWGSCSPVAGFKMMAAVEKPARRANDATLTNSDFKPSEWPDHCRNPQRLMDSKPSHILSKRSSELKRDTFIWVNTFPSALLAGINQRLIPFASATLQRCQTRELNPLYWGPFVLAPVDVAPYGVTSYTIEATGLGIPSLSTNPLPPGDNGWFFPVFASPFQMEAQASRG